MNYIYSKCIKPAIEYTVVFLKWVALSLIIGSCGGVLGGVFHKSIDAVTELRLQHTWILYFLPLGGLVIAALYNFAKKYGNIDTNRVLESANSDKNIPLVMVPLIVVSTVITHLFGGSAGREGAALQLGGGMAYGMGRLMRLPGPDMHTAVLSGMSAVFAALFGTPLTAAFFSLEVVNVGIMHYSALVPCMLSAVCGYAVSAMMGTSPVRFCVALPKNSVAVTVSTLMLAALCAVLSIVFCFCVEKCTHFLQKFISNAYLRIFVGGAAVVVLSLALGTRDYNGAGMDVIARAMGGTALPAACVAKLVFTSVTVGSGYKGGEIVPAFFIGSTFGCVMAPLLGLDPTFAAAVGFISMFCGAVNCPVASVLLAVEVFGTDSLLLMAQAVAVSYMLSGSFGLYSGQKLIFSKLTEKYRTEQNA